MHQRELPATTDRFPDCLIEVKKAIAWAREHARERGANPEHVVLAGSSAGAHLAVTAALTENDPAFQPGFESADTTVSAAVGLYGYYGYVDSRRQPRPSSPVDYADPDARPLLIAHGDKDTFPGVPPGYARAFVEELRRAGTDPVVYIELPGTQDSFDLLHSIRFETVIDGIEDFTAWVGVGRRPAGPAPCAQPKGSLAGRCRPVRQCPGGLRLLRLLDGALAQ